MDADVIVIGGGLAGLVATHELTSRGKRVAVLDQENAANLGGQAFWSFGGIFLVDSPEQRRMRIKDSFELAWNDWQGSAQFDRLDDLRPQYSWNDLVNFFLAELSGAKIEHFPASAIGREHFEIRP